MKKLLLLTAITTLSMNAVAGDVIDIYGERNKETDKVIMRHAKDIREIELYLNQQMKNENLNLDSPEFKDMFVKKILLTEKIRRELGYLYVNFDTIYYPDHKNIYTTVEVISKKTPERLQFLSVEASPESQEKHSKYKPDLIDKPGEYDHVAFPLVVNHQLKDAPCPAYHCSWGFGHESLKPYIALFNTGATQQKTLIINTLNKDTDPERRTAAAFLMGHFTDPKEIIAQLTPHVTDNNDGVRNMAMRVLSATMEKSKIRELDPTPFIKLLDSPYDTDRNKSLFVLLQITESKASHPLIIKKGGQKLIALLELKQPNNHKPAYQILKKISGKDFGSKNIGAWKKWVRSAQATAV